MTPASNTLLALILTALGIIGVILSFLVPDRKKSILSLALAGLILLAGVVQFAQQSASRYRWQKRMSQIQKERQVDLEELRNRLRNKAAETRATAEKAKEKK